MKITNQIRMAVIFCSAVIMLFSITMVFNFMFKNFQSFSGKEQIANQFLLLLCGSFILYVISVYMRQKGLTRLSSTFMYLLILNIISSVFSILHQMSLIQLGYKAIGSIYGVLGIIRFVLLIVILVNVTTRESEKVKGTKEIKYFAIAFLVAFVFSYIGPRLVTNMGPKAYTSVLSLLFAIPFIFIIMFAKQIKEEEI